MFQSFLWGLLAAGSLIFGGIIAVLVLPGKKVLGIITAFGAGTLISAVSYELVYESVKLGKGSGLCAFGLFAGALTYFFADKILENLGSRNHKKGNVQIHSGMVIPMILAIILDGIPESIVIGLGIFEGGTVSMAMLVAVFISNIPESVAASAGMKSGGWAKGRVISLWVFIAIICAFASVAGYSFFSGLPVLWISFIQAFAGGAILIMLANSMIPESYEHAGKIAGLFTITGFFISVYIVFLEHSF